jgi:hypothetical protein
MTGDIVQIAIPVAALAIIGNIILGIVNRRAVNALTNGGLSEIIKSTAEGQKLCQGVLSEIKTSTALQTEFLRDIRDTLKQMLSKQL